MYSRQSREWLYELTLRYQAFLQETGLLDENDLAREFLKKVSQKEMALFDFVIADEIQDLTEIQIYCQSSGRLASRTPWTSKET